MLLRFANVARQRFASQALLMCAASAPPGQDLSEMFALYKEPPYTIAPLPVGEEPQPLNILKPRGEVHRDGDWHRSVHIWLVDDDQRVLLQKRSEFKDTHPGLFDVSCAGHITANDPVLETAVRELEEELGITMDPEDLNAAWVCTVPSIGIGETPKHGKFTCREFQEIYVVEGWDGDVESLKVGADEVAGVELIDAGELLAAWEDGDPRFVPRADHYRRVIGAQLGFYPFGGW